MTRPVLQPGRVRVRHITRDDTSPLTVLGKGMRGSYRGLYGLQGWQSGSYEDRVNDAADFKLTLPNAPGSDGRLHRDRFATITDPVYHPGDEWVEIYRARELVYTGTPTGYDSITSSTIELSGSCARRMLEKQRETAAGWVVHGPHDAIAALCDAWSVLTSQAFTSPDAPAMSASGAEQTTTDGRFTYLEAARTADGAHLTAGGQLAATAPVTTGYSSKAWRAETTIRRGDTATAVTLLVGPHGGGTPEATLALNAAGTLTATSGGVTATSTPTNVRPVVALAIEGRGRWVFFYLDGQLVQCLPVTHQTAQHQAQIQSAGEVWVRALLTRQLAPFITPKILDRRLAGAPPPTGLYGTYWDDSDLPAGETGRLFSPARDAYAKRTDPQINFPTGAIPAWQPAGSDGQRMSVRWTGAIYLDLAQTDIRLRVTSDDATNIWVGPTAFDEKYLAAPNTTGPWLRAHLNTLDSGWYPIVIEYSNLGGNGGVVLEAERSVNAGTWISPGDPSNAAAPALSPYGVYDQYVRYDTFAAQITDVEQAFGLQTRLVPRSLESGEFPARMEIAPRVGRDTAKVLTRRDTGGASAQGSASDIVDSLICDAAGLATDDSSSGALTIEALAHAQLGQHVLVHQDTEALSDITDPVLLQQRAASLLALRSSMWEQLQVQPVGFNELTDTFPLTGLLAELAWRAGDGLRRRYPEVATVDETPTQFLLVQWPIVPGGRGAPTVSFRARPRGLRTALKQLARRLAVTQRAQVTTPRGSSTV